jgi:hypothetical protein
MRFILTISLLCVGFSLQAKETQIRGKVCPHPEKPCLSASHEFAAHELTFVLPTQLKWMSSYYSVEFYAVILRSMKTIPVKEIYGDEECKGFIEESERLVVQTKFPDRKVFTSRNGCGIATAVFYSNTNEEYNFIAVYAGETKAVATKILEQVKKAGYPDASLRKMQVMLDNGD